MNNPIASDENKDLSDINDEFLPENIEEAQSRRRKKILSIVLFLLANVLVVLVVFFMERRQQEMESWTNIQNYFSTYWHYFVIAFSMFILLIIGDTIVFATLTKRMKMEKNIAVAIKLSIYGRYYDRITPWAIGGEPFQLAYLIKNKMKVSDAGAVTMSRHIIRFFVTAIAVITILIASRITTDIWVMVVAILSVLAGLIVPTFMIICVFKPKLGTGIAKGVIGILHRLKIVKDYDKQLANLQKGVDNFLHGLEYLSANKKVIIVIGLVALTELFANNAIPFFIIKGLGVELCFWEIFVLCIFVNYASSFAPTPGGAGLAELSFYAIFASYLGGGLLFWAVLFWRITIYYAPIIIGFVLQLIESVLEIVKNRKIH
ncbi:MAG TPA: lysylphosphatidylglycerol synthase transmembrane domain-containing protein [Clostridia bacterium]|nr:lysylphosphatidylglycerol synthase transmembrane domain-containing protein [Clostridia bacterium]